MPLKERGVDYSVSSIDSIWHANDVFRVLVFFAHGSPRTPLLSSLQAAPPRLVVLDIGLNFVDDEAMEVVARGLEKNRVLTTLVLQGNGIGEKVKQTKRNKSNQIRSNQAAGRAGLAVSCCHLRGGMLSWFDLMVLNQPVVLSWEGSGSCLRLSGEESTSSALRDLLRACNLVHTRHAARYCTPFVSRHCYLEFVVVQNDWEDVEC